MTLLEYISGQSDIDTELVNDFVTELSSTETYVINEILINKYLNTKTKKQTLQEILKSNSYKENADYIYKETDIFMTIPSFIVGLINVKSKSLRQFLFLYSHVTMYNKRLLNEQSIELNRVKNISNVVSINTNNVNKITEYESKLLEYESNNIKQEETILGLEKKIKLLEDFNKASKEIITNGNTTVTSNNNNQINKEVITDIINDMNEKLDRLLEFHESNTRNIKKISSTVFI